MTSTEAPIVGRRYLPVVAGALGLVVAGASCSPFRLPELGPCSVLPVDDSGVLLDAYEYGQIGIGTCLSAPADLQVRPDPEDPTNHFIFAVNSNAASNFRGSSLLAIDASSIDLTCPVNGLHELRSSALGMQEFAGRLAFDDETGVALLTSRQSGGLDGDLTDPIYTIDATNPRDLGFHDRGPRQFGPFRYVQVPADPWSIVISPSDRRAYGLGLTTHEIFALDLVTDPLSYVDLVGERSVSKARFIDADESGSDPDFELLAVDTDLLQNETMRVELAGGTVRIYHPGPGPDGIDALFRADSGDAGASFVAAAGGADLIPGDSTWADGGIGAASVARISGRLEGLVAGTASDGTRSIGRAQATDNAIDWSLFNNPEVEPLGAGWDAAGVFDPEFWIDSGTYDVFWSGGDALGEAIGHAAGSSLSLLEREGDPTLGALEDGIVLAAADGEWDSGGVFGPSVLRNGSTSEWLLYYTGFAEGPDTPEGLPPGLAIGLATSDVPSSFTRTAFGAAGTSVVLGRGATGEWDDAAVTHPSVLFRNGRFHLWYQGFDGASWATGLAHSVDGVTWTKDHRNPVYEGVVDESGLPRRAFVSSVASGGYYTLEGDVSGTLREFAEEGPIFEGSSSSIRFRIVGGQALGQGDSGTFDEDGVGSPSPVGVGDLVAYLGHDSGRRRAALAVDGGAALVRAGTLDFEGFTGAAATLNGSDPSAVPLSLDFRTVGNVTWAAVEVADAIYLASGDLSTGSTLQAANGGAPIVVPLEAGEFDDSGVSVPALLVTDTSCRLYYEADDGNAPRIGLVEAPTCDELGTAPHQLTLDRGAAGTWDDASLQSPTALIDPAGLFHLWYIGSDGETPQVGHATSTDGVSWSRERSGEQPVPVYDPTNLAFAGEGITRLAAELHPAGFVLWFEGSQGGIRRIGRARSPDGVDFIEVTNPTTAGDRFEIDTRRGDASVSSGIYIGDSGVTSSPIVDGVLVHGAGASELILSPDGKFGLVANKRTGYIIVLDLYDDSTDDYVDANVNDIEAILTIPQVGTRMIGIRELKFSPDGNDLYALLGPLVNPGSGTEAARRGPEGLLRLDWTQVTDEPIARAIRENIVTGWMPAARGSEEPEGYDDDVSIGPIGLTLSTDGSRAYFANFNDNSFWVLDVTAGARGAVLAMVDGLDERPSEVALSPDGTLAYVSTSFGELHGSAASSTMHVIDVDESSDTFGTVLTTLSNVSSRAEAGCTEAAIP